MALSVEFKSHGSHGIVWQVRATARPLNAHAQIDHTDLWQREELKRPYENTAETTTRKIARTAAETITKATDKENETNALEKIAIQALLILHSPEKTAKVYLKIHANESLGFHKYIANCNLSDIDIIHVMEKLKIEYNWFREQHKANPTKYNLSNLKLMHSLSDPDSDFQAKIDCINNCRKIYKQHFE